ncbi:uncharacterized protein C1orf87 [Aplysia californica]|uniref:Uncharacterized protein C1orf87 n=1 Tax=Aplysia californica TaxID=6500 RepID=A0ABM1VW41_APLCA|nr:uncharacterized protein C1orf87 [Aplysia californica]
MYLSEVTELDHIRVAALTTRDAPFGTTDTPTFKPRIIGGNMVNVIERPADVTHGFPRYEKLSLISDKPNNIDPRALTDFNRRYNVPYRDPFSKNSTTGKPTYITKRPDSKDISSKYPTLAPIDGNRMKNHQLSTVFEPESWTRRYYKEREEHPAFGPAQNGVGRGGVNGLTGSHSSFDAIPPSTSGSSNSVPDDQFKSRLLAMIPRGVFLPDTPIVLTQKDEMRLLTMLAQELYYADPVKLRDVYLDIANSADKQLRGYCQYQELFHSLARVSLKLPPDLLQLVAAMFVSDHRNQRDVNYEKFLSFVGVAMKSKDRVAPPNNNNYSSPRASQYFQPNTIERSNVRHRPGQPFLGDGGESKLLRMVETQLIDNEYEIDFERLINSFQQEDRELRGTLSADQIKSVCFRHRLPIQESLIMSVLHRCEDNNRDEQYNWWAFVEFLERVQPAKTGLPIPTSKRPLEYAKQLPAPNANWPKAESQANSPRRGAAQPWREPPLASPRRDEGPDPNREILSRMDLELKDLEKNYEEMKSKSSRQGQDEQPWFKSFMQFADALYKQDEQYAGSLPYADVAEWTKLYNDAYRLEIPDHVISQALSQSTKGGSVNIHMYLTLLGRR